MTYMFARALARCMCSDAQVVIALVIIIGVAGATGSVITAGTVAAGVILVAAIDR